MLICVTMQFANMLTGGHPNSLGRTEEVVGIVLTNIERILGDLADIDQPSVQWHVAQMLQHLRDDLSDDQEQRATGLLQRNLAGSTDWTGPA